MAWTYAGDCASKVAFAFFGRPVGAVAGAMVLTVTPDDRKLSIPFVELGYRNTDSVNYDWDSGFQC